MIKTIIILGLFTYIYFRFKRKNKLIDNLRKTLSDTHNHYREKYDFFIHFKERYDELLLTSQENNKVIEHLKKEIKRHLVNIREYEILLQKLNEDEELTRDRITIIKSERNEFTLDSKDLVIVETTKPKIARVSRVKKPKVE